MQIIKHHCYRSYCFLTMLLCSTVSISISAAVPAKIAPLISQQENMLMKNENAMSRPYNKKSKRKRCLYLRFPEITFNTSAACIKKRYPEL